MGSGVKKVVKKAKKKIHEVGEGRVFKYLGGPGVALLGEQLEKHTGINDAVFNPLGAINEAAGRKFIEKPRELKQQAEKLEKETVAQNKATLKRLKNREAQEGAEADAAKDLLTKRRKQDRRRRSAGKQGTILTDSLGGAGGESSDRKTLLGK